jgi:hypothetical protein
LSAPNWRILWLLERGRPYSFGQLDAGHCFSIQPLRSDVDEWQSICIHEPVDSRSPEFICSNPPIKSSLPVDDCQAFPIYRTGYPLRKKESVQYPATILQRSVRWQLKSHPLALVVERLPVQSVCQRSPRITFWWCGYYQHNTYTVIHSSFHVLKLLTVYEKLKAELLST